MKLLKLSCAQLAELQAALDAVGTAAGKLIEGGLEPEISLTVNGTILRAPSILCEYAEVDPVQIVEHDVAPIDPPVHATRSPDVEASASAAPQINHPGPPVQDRRIEADGFLRGPWLPREESQLIDLHVAGDTWAQIAARLNRPKSAVMFRAHKVLKDRINEAKRAARKPAARKPGGGSAAKTAPRNTGPSGTAPLDAAGGVVAGGPVAVSPPARDETAVPVHDPRQSPPELTGEARQLWLSLQWLRPDPAFDAELDLDLVEGLSLGRKLGEIALDLGVDAAAAKARFMLLSGDIRDAKGNVRIDGQQALVKALRARALLARKGAA